MAERWPAMTDEELGRALTDLSTRIDYPETPDLVSAVQARLRAEPSPHAPWWMAAGWRRVGFATAIIVVLVASLLVFSPAVRRAVADFLGVGGIRIVTGGEPPTELAGDLVLGEPVTLVEAREGVSFNVRVPERAPDELYVDDLPPGGQVTFVYAAGDDLPALLDTDVGLLLSEFRATVDVYVKKVIDSGARVEPVGVDGVTGYWLTGEHYLVYQDLNGEVRTTEARLAGRTLLWERDGITYRLESGLAKVDAIAFAQTLP